MLSTGIVRKLDEHGRIVLPKELRGTLKIARKDSLEVFIDDKTILLKKFEPGCIFCGRVRNVVSIHGKNICLKCQKDFK